MPDDNTKPEPQNFGDLSMQPTESGSADLEAAYMEAALDGAAADGSIDAGIMDGTKAHENSTMPTEGGPAEEESAAQPS